MKDEIGGRQLVMDQAWGLTPIDNPRLAELCLMHHHCIKNRKIAKKLLKYTNTLYMLYMAIFFLAAKTGAKNINGEWDLRHALVILPFYSLCTIQSQRKTNHVYTSILKYTMEEIFQSNPIVMHSDNAPEILCTLQNPKY